MNVIQAINNVMAEVREVRKSERMEAPGQKYMFRGVDQVVEALSAEVRKQGIVIVPIASEAPAYQTAVSSQGKNLNCARVLVTYRVYGPEGDFIDGAAPGESMDSGDKAVAKAMSVAWRTFLLQMFFLPPKDPDPDSEVYETAAVVPSAVAARQREAVYSEWQDRVADLRGDRDGLLSLYAEAQKARVGQAVLGMILAAGKEAGKP